MPNSAIFPILLGVLLVTSLIAVIVHEAAHVIAARTLTRIVPTRLRIGGGPLLIRRSGFLDVEIRLVPVEGAVHYAGEVGERPVPIDAVSWDDASPRERMLVSLAGPLAHASIFVLAFWLAGLLQVGGTLVFVMQACCIVHIAAAAVSLVPGPESDGGHVYRSLRRMPAHANDAVSTRLFQNVVNAVLTALTAWAVFQLAEHSHLG